MAELQADLRFLGQGQVGLEVCVHCLGCDLVFLLLYCGFVSQAMDGGIGLFLRSVGVLKEVSACKEGYFSLSLFLI